jgi:hypothetical protein
LFVVIWYPLFKKKKKKKKKKVTLNQGIFLANINS